MSYVKRPLSEAEMQIKLDEVRNNVAKKMGNWADRLSVSMAFTPIIERIEGEVWSDGNDKWVQRAGYKEKLTTHDESRMPWWCPKCSKPMNHRFDRKFFYLRNMCFNCNIDWEGQLRIDGTWEAFEKRMVRENEKAFLRDKIQENQDYIRTFKLPQMHFGDGRFEVIAELSDFEGKFKELEDDSLLCMQRLEQIAKEEQEESNVGTSTE